MGIAFVFPGQGSQDVGMGKALAENFAAARDVFDEVDAALGEKLSAIMWEGPKETLTLTANAQPALMAVSMAVMRVLEREKGFNIADKVKFVAGHSLGNIPRSPPQVHFHLPMQHACCDCAAKPCKRQCRSVRAPWPHCSASVSMWRRK